MTIKLSELRCVFILAVLVIGYASALQAQNSEQSNIHAVFPSMAWANQPWTGDNRPYHAARSQVDQLAARGKLTFGVVQVYYLQWQKAPRDPMLLFRWAYADNVAVRLSYNPPQHFRPGDGAFEACPDPHAYDYERIRYLINWPGNEIVLLPMAKRLLAHDPNDYPIQFNLAARYGGRDSPAQKAASIARAKRLLAQYPNKPGIYGILGGIYCDHFFWQKDPADGQKAIAYYNKYLQLTPADDPWRKQAEYWIDQIHHRTL